MINLDIFNNRIVNWIGEVNFKRVGERSAVQPRKKIGKLEILHNRFITGAVADGAE